MAEGKKLSRMEQQAAGLAVFDLDNPLLPKISARSGLTGPGQSLFVRKAESDANQRVQEMQDKLDEFAGKGVVLSLDPKRIGHSRFANRHADSFSDAEFVELKSDIADHGGNVQPIKVRASTGGGSEFDYEVVFGHRRSRACLELGLNVNAVLEELDDAALFIQMERENRSQKRLSPWEQGMMYARALDEGLFPSNSQLAKAVGQDLGNVGKALTLARLPGEVIGAFDSPNDLQYRWAKDLNELIQSSPELVTSRCAEIRASTVRGSPAEIFAAILGEESVKPENLPRLDLKTFKAGRLGVLQVEKDGSATLKLKKGRVAVELMEKFAEYLGKFEG
jgi:ParB family transcriptional regulator, chromosome partitioning protein